MLQVLLNLPWSIKYWMGSHPLRWRVYAGICRRVGWNASRLGWYTAKNGPYSGIRLRATHPNNLWVPTGLYEPSVAWWLVRLLREEKWGCLGKPIWDVGAYIGCISLLCARHDRGPVLAFEPLEKNIKLLKDHLKANPAIASQIEIIQAAVSDRDGEADFLIRQDGALSQLLREDVPSWKQQAVVGKVKTVRMDSLLLEGREAPGLLKLDIEGAEAVALTGATRLLQKHRPVVLMEIHTPRTTLDAVTILKDAGYVLRKIAGKRLKKMDETCFESGHFLAVDRKIGVRGKAL